MAYEDMMMRRCAYLEYFGKALALFLAEGNLRTFFCTKDNRVNARMILRALLCFLVYGFLRTSLCEQVIARIFFAQKEAFPVLSYMRSMEGNKERRNPKRLKVSRSDSK